MSQHLIDTRRYSAHEDAHGNGKGNDEPNNVRHLRAPSGANAESEGHREPSRSPQDATLDALDALGDALEQLAKDQHLLESRLKDLHRERADGRSWREILSEEDAPGTMQIVSRMLACLAKASGTLRKELVDSLRREGVSIPAIAKLFGVTHQRVSNLLRRPAD